MGTPGTFSNPALDVLNLEDEKVALAYQEGHDADIPSNLGSVNIPTKHDPTMDVEKGEPSNAMSTNSEDPTLTEREGVGRHEEEDDPNIVFWDGPDDPENPMNWTMKQKWGIIALLSVVTLVTSVPMDL